MHYEERIINGSFYYRTIPDGEWIMMSSIDLARRVQLLDWSAQQAKRFNDSQKGCCSNV